jgi:hypothetical protein
VWIDVHDDWSIDWEIRVSSECSATKNLFRKNQALILKHFGISVWTSPIQLPKNQAQNVWGGMDWRTPQTTAAWLTLPTKQSLKREWQASDHEDDDGHYDVEDECNVTISPPHLPSSAIAKFNRALTMLGLKPHLHPTQHGLLAYGEGRSADQELTKWPKFTMLIRSKQEY